MAAQASAGAPLCHLIARPLHLLVPALPPHLHGAGLGWKTVHTNVQTAAADGPTTAGVRVATRRPVLPNLTGARIFAAVYVLLYHLFGSTAPGRPWYDSWIDGGYLGVSLFFVLSGFILAYNAPPVGNTRKFYVLRLARVYPLYLAAMLWALPNYLRHGVVPARFVIPADLLLLQTWFGPGFAIQINPPSWSLSAEAFFYLLFPLLLPAVRRWMTHPKLLLALLAVAAVLPATAVSLVLWSRGQGISGLSEAILGVPLFRVAEFTVGIVFGELYARRQPVIDGARTALALLVSLAMIGLSVGHLPFPIVRTGLFALPFGWLLYCLAGWRSRLLSSAPMQLLGEISYGVYLLQIPLYMTFSFAYKGPHAVGVGKAMVLLLILPVAYLFYVVVEKPGRLLILRIFGMHSHAKPIETPQRGLA